MGGVCPFATRPGVKVYLDNSLKINQVVYPAAGENHCVVRLDLAELAEHARSSGWIDVSKSS